MMRKTDISKYRDDAPSTPSVSAGTVVSSAFSSFFRLIMTILLIILMTGIVIGTSLLIYLFNLSNEPLNIDLNKLRLSLTSYVYVAQDDEMENWIQYKPLYSSENRVWVDYQDIPKEMIDAQIAIEDKRFLEHKGVDWYRTGGAVFSLATGKGDFGGSTLTQQLIKNITDDNENSINRKLREIFRALKLEEAYSKDDIIEAYLNIVNYGNGCRGVQSAAKLYFNKTIQNCSIAECAAIAGITQNPVAYDPLNYPEKNQEKRELVIQEMYTQGRINPQQYTEAMEESKNMKFVGYIVEGDDDDEQSDWNWYMDRMFRDVSQGLSKKLNVDTYYAEQMIYNGGLQIYSAMDLRAQEIAEKKVREWKTPNDTTLEIGYELMDFEGRVLATVGGRKERDGMLLWDNVTQSVLQPGSTIKPVSSYILALENKSINFSSLISDRPVSDWGLDSNGNVVSGPNNWYLSYYGDITVTRALNISSNAAAVNVIKNIGLDKSYQFLTESLGFKHLDAEKDKENLAGLSIGGFYGGTTVEEMTASYQMFCNGGYYYEPYTYLYVTDSEGNVILDNRDRGKPDQIISSESSTIMNRLLHDVVNAGGEALGFRAKIDGWDIIGKTGTTDESYDNWFVGASPYAVSGVWTGHKKPAPIPAEEQGQCHYLWRDIMQEWLEGKDQKSYNLGGDVEQHNYIVSSGLITNIDASAGDKIATGYYTADNMPSYTTYNPYAPPKTETSHNSENSYSRTEESDDPEESETSEEPEEPTEPEEPEEPEEPTEPEEPETPEEPTEPEEPEIPEEPTEPEEPEPTEDDE